MKIFKPTVIAAIAILLSGCVKRELPPVEVVDEGFGIVEESSPESRYLDVTKNIPLRVGTRYGYVIYLRTNKDAVHYTEVLELAGPAQWGVNENEKFVISPDKKKATVERERHNEGDPFSISEVWRVSEGDPAGRARLTVTIEGKIVRTFDFDLVNP